MEEFSNSEAPTEENKKAAIKRSNSEGTELVVKVPSTQDLIIPLPTKFSDVGENLEELLRMNKIWANAITAQKPDFFAEHAKSQKPHILWIGCSDSRVPAETIVQLGPGEIFVHRNIANQFNHVDLNCLSVLEYAVEHLGVEHIIVCGHYGCGGVAASMTNKQFGIVDNWLCNLKDVYWKNKKLFTSELSEEERNGLLVRLNVKQQVYNISATSIVQRAWASGNKLKVHGWVYDLGTGLLEDIDIGVESEAQLCDQIYRVIS
ncbi:990_t:CDS:2 [Acaulospora colombiana]|uniref:990_t:CDS:1 n=1 Tax=Acaulospora colombiana TaxID=27376 RepID=A0ACA9MXQ3_9GLOM|nr:990_t:CDS:2 [Acaulospora colombiana]